MNGINLIIVISVALAIFMALIYFIRWVFGFDKMIELQREQTRLLRRIADNLDKHQK